MAPIELVSRLDRALTGFREHCESDENLFPKDTPHGVFCALSEYVSAHEVTEASWERIAALVNSLVDGGDEDLDNAACTCFLENLADRGHPLRRHLRGGALAYWIDWEPAG